MADIMLSGKILSRSLAICLLWLLDSNGKDLPLSSVYNREYLQSFTSEGHSVSIVILRIEKEEEEFVFVDIPERPIPSLLRNYSAPVRLVSDITDDDLYFLLAHDSDEFNRWEAGQTLARKLMLSLVDKAQHNQPLSVDPKFVNGLRSILCDSSLDKEFIAKAITLPGEGEIMDLMEVADPDAVHGVRHFVRKQLAFELRVEFCRAVETNRSSEEYDPNHDSMARRALKNTSLAYLASLNEPEMMELVLHEYKSSINMTEQFAALGAVSQNVGDVQDEVLSDFYQKWKEYALVIIKWPALQAVSDIPGNVRNVQRLLEHLAFDIRNPNKVYSLIGGFCSSSVNFHAKMVLVMNLLEIWC